MKTPLLSPLLVECLALVRVASDAGIGISGTHIDRYVEEPRPNFLHAGDEWTLFGPHSATMATFLDSSHARYLEAVGWIRCDPLEDSHIITKLGRAVLESHERDSPAQPDFSVVLDPDAPVDYALFAHHLSTLSHVLVVDPYLAGAFFPVLANMPSIRRLLIRKSKAAGQSWADRAGSIRATLALVPGIEVRFTESRDLHDRLVLPSVGRGVLLGGSLGGRQANTAISLPEHMTTLHRDAMQAIWDEAESLEPIALEQSAHIPTSGQAPTQVDPGSDA